MIQVGSDLSLDRINKTNPDFYSNVHFISFHFSFFVLADEVMKISRNMFIYIFEKSCPSCLANGNHCKENQQLIKVTKTPKKTRY